MRFLEGVSGMPGALSFSTIALRRGILYPLPAPRGSLSPAGLVSEGCRWQCDWLTFCLDRTYSPKPCLISQMPPGHLHVLSSPLLLILYSPHCTHPVEQTHQSHMESFFLGVRVLSLFSLSWHININSLLLCSCFLLLPQGTGTFSCSLCQTEAVFEGVGRHTGSTGTMMSLMSARPQYKLVMPLPAAQSSQCPLGYVL